MMRLESKADLERLVENGIPESGSLEYKETLSISSRKERLEVLKDLTGMANGGGGTVLFGIRESSNDFPTAETIVPIVDRTRVGSLEDVVRAGVRPPLLMDLTVIDVDNGYCLVAGARPSPLGPYMVDAYGEQRYHARHGTRTTPMSEREVRDAYNLASRVLDRRPTIWLEHSLPVALPETDTPWITATAIPSEPLRDLIDVAQVEPATLVPEGDLRGYLGAFLVNRALDNLGRWADGYFGDDTYGESRPPKAFVRLHRDGSAAIGVRLVPALDPVFTTRVLHAEILYLSWLWSTYDPENEVELRLEIRGIREASFNIGSLFGQDQSVRVPTGVDVNSVALSQYLLPSDLACAPTRHEILKRFSDRLFHAFGQQLASPLFRTGELYGKEGQHIGFSMAGSAPRDGKGRARGRLYSDGSVYTSQSELVGYWRDGVLTNPSGDVLGALEMAPGNACPKDFVALRVLHDPRAKVPGGHPGVATDPPTVREPPAPTGHWADDTLDALLDP